jgi:RNA-directed DNA polymerase
MEGLSQKQMPGVISGIRRQRHAKVEDRVVSNSKHIMSPVETPRYKWDTIPWSKLEKKVFKLQKRIYQASKEGDTVRVRKLERLLLTSMSAKLLATRKVTQENQGKKTAGIDGKAGLSKTKRIALAMSLSTKATSMPLRRAWIPKKGKETLRPLGIPTIMDRAKQTLVKMALEPEWEARFDTNKYGFRPERSCQDAIEEIFCAIKTKQVYVLDADISDCFDNINHEVLLKKLNTSPTIRRMIKRWLKSGIIDNNVFTPTYKGTPQGGTISPLLANIALNGMEEDIKNALVEDLFQYMKRKRKEEVRTQVQPSSWRPVRRRARQNLSIIMYADDFVIIHESLEIVEKAKAYIASWLKNIGLELKEEKSSIRHTYLRHEGKAPGFDFLGFNIRQYQNNNRRLGYITIIKPSSGSVKRHLREITNMLRQHRGCNQHVLIKKLNPIIRGWSGYYRCSVASDIFQKASYETIAKLLLWARWKHPKKGAKWRKNKYFHSDTNSKWRFRTQDNLRLVLHNQYKIQRFTKVRGEKSPFDGDILYWNNRSKGKYRSVSSLRVC